MKRSERAMTRWAYLPWVQAVSVWMVAALDVPSLRAQECKIPVAAAPSLAAATPETRIAFIAQTLRETAKEERRFALGWSLSYVGLAAGTWLFIPFSSDSRQWVESAFNSGTSAFAALFVLVGPVGAIRDQQRLERLLAKSAGSGDRCAVLAESERLLLHVAENQASARNAFAHLGNFAFNIGLGLVLGYALDRPSGAAVNTSIGIALGELMIATRPTSAERSLERYRLGDLHPQSTTLAMPLTVTPLSMGSGYGVGISGAF